VLEKGALGPLRGCLQTSRLFTTSSLQHICHGDNEHPTADAVDLRAISTFTPRDTPRHMEAHAPILRIVHTNFPQCPHPERCGTHISLALETDVGREKRHTASTALLPRVTGSSIGILQARI
jgi:hypothetical protein